MYKKLSLLMACAVTLPLCGSDDERPVNHNRQLYKHIAATGALAGISLLTARGAFKAGRLFIRSVLYKPTSTHNMSDANAVVFKAGEATVRTGTGLLGLTTATLLGMVSAGTAYGAYDMYGEYKKMDSHLTEWDKIKSDPAWSGKNNKN